MVEAHEIALDVEFDDKSAFAVVVGGLANMKSEALLAIERAFALAARIGVGLEAAVPPLGADVVEEVVDDAIAEGRGDNLADDGVANDEGDPAAGFVVALDDAVAQGNNVFHVVEFETMLVDSFAFALARVSVGLPQLVEEKILESFTPFGHFGRWADRCFCRRSAGQERLWRCWYLWRCWRPWRHLWRHRARLFRELCDRRGFAYYIRGR